MHINIALKRPGANYMNVLWMNQENLHAKVFKHCLKNRVFFILWNWIFLGDCGHKKGLIFLHTVASYCFPNFEIFLDWRSSYHMHKMLSTCLFDRKTIWGTPSKSKSVHRSRNPLTKIEKGAEKWPLGPTKYPGKKE